MKPLHFIVGCPRSGTYLLSNMLDQTGQIAIPTETHFIPLFSRYAFLAGNLKNVTARTRLLRAIYAFLEIWLTRAEMERGFDEMTKHSLLTTQDEFEKIVQEARTYPETIHAIYEKYAMLKGKTLYGDKSAFFQHIPLEDLDHASGRQGKFIHIVRDGRDVFLSWRKLSMGPENLAIAARVWRDHITQKRRWGTLHPERYCEIRYEDLLENPEREARRLCEFIGIEFNPEMLNFHSSEMAQAIANSSTHSMLGKPIDAANREKWRTQMTSEDIAYFDWVAGAALATTGYPRANLPITGITKLGFTYRNILAGMQSIFTYRAFRLYLKNTLPGILIAMGYCGVKVERIVNSKAWLKMETMPIRRRK